MKFGVSIGNFGRFGSDTGIAGCLEVAERADEFGFHSVWVNDHVIIPQHIESRYPYSADGKFSVSSDAEVYEPLVLMSALGAITRRVRIGVSVLVLPYRHPIVTAKMLATADLLSEGRIILGAGVGWMREEFDALGLPEGHYEHRGSVTSEYIAAIKEMWTNTGPSNYSGRFVAFRDVGTFPKPLQRPHPPIVIGGKGPAAWRRASRLGNGFHTVAVTPDELREEVAGLRAACAADHRDPSELEISLLARIRFTQVALSGEDRPMLTGAPEQVAEDIRKFANAGLRHLVATPETDAAGAPLGQVLGGMQLMADEILPAFGDQG